MATAEFFWAEPNNEPKDEFILRYPDTLAMAPGDDIELMAFSETDNKFQHGKYIIKFIEPDSIGVVMARIGVSPNA